tara:strand:+ start:822 stop:3587 length:2766 start_codon:yes stop_codon:yes gene_type:complete
MKRLSRPRLLLAIAAAVMALVLLPRLWIELQWFEQFGLGPVVLKRWGLQFLALTLVLGIGIPVQLNQLQRSWRLRRRDPASRGEDMFLPLNGWALLLVLLLVLGLLSTATSYLFVQAFGLLREPFSGIVLSSFPVLGSLPLPLVIGIAVVLLVFLLRWPLTTLRLSLSLAILASATALARAWSFWLPAILASPFGQGDPVTGIDLSFTVLRLPAFQLVLSVLMAQGLVGLSACLWLCLSQGTTLSDWRFAGFNRQQQAVLRPQLAVLALAGALMASLAPFELMVQSQGVVAGAGWVDLHLRLPLRLLLSLVLLAMLLSLLLPLRQRRRLLLPAAITALVLPLVELITAPLLQKLVVQPRELQMEKPYLERMIQGTRQAFDLNRMKVRTLSSRQQLTPADLEQSPGTLENIRLWDTQPLLEANAELQQLRLVYDFWSAAVDRYQLSDDISRGRQQVMVAAREVDVAALPPSSRTWLNQHLVFTHGYGFTVSPVNSFEDGLPQYFVKDLGKNRVVQGLPNLGVTTAQAIQAFPIGQPELYFGASPSLYAVAPSKVREFNFPDGEENVYSHYSGDGGLPIGHPLQRLLAAAYLREPRLLFGGSLRQDSRLLLRRQVQQRLHAIAPFLTFESQPYLVTTTVPAVDGYRSEQHQYWLLDGFTSSRSYPYSAPNPSGLRYFRNPVKVVVDALNGRVWIYVMDPDDPVLRTWRNAFPEMFRPLKAMPMAIRDHLQVPITQFQTQAERLLRFHVTEVRSFYNGDDVWAVPKEIYGAKQVAVRPYHVTLQLPGQERPEFVLLLPFTPLGRTNMVSWLAARNSVANYGQLRLWRFPQQRLLLGPQQISALIETDPEISRQFGLWNREGSRVLQGNLLVIPMGEEGLLYVEPIYLQARSGGIPTLVRVIVSDGRRFAMEKDLNTALQKLMAS